MSHLSLRLLYRISHYRWQAATLSDMAQNLKNRTCKELNALHVPGRPLVLCNVYDAVSARVVASVPTCKVIATTSYGIAASLGVDDQALSLEQNVNAVRAIAAVAAKANKPLTVDVQDGYGDQLENAIAALIDVGVAGVNLEDCDKDSLEMFPLEDAVSRIKRALAVAESKGLPDFVVNARIDSLLRGEEFEDVLARGKAYLAAGATTVFVVDGPERRAKLDEKKTMIDSFGGLVNLGVSLMEGHSAVEQMSSLGVARISIGPQLYLAAANSVQRQAEILLTAA